MEEENIEDHYMNKLKVFNQKNPNQSEKDEDEEEEDED